MRTITVYATFAAHYTFSVEDDYPLIETLEDVACEGIDITPADAELVDWEMADPGPSA